jgi:endonuclease YncB( thermonuclease family)
LSLLKFARLDEVRGWVFIVGILVVVTLTIAIPYAIAAKDAKRPVQQLELTRLTLPPGISLSDLTPGTVKDIIDADSINVVIDGKTTGVRYYGVDAPAGGQKCYREAVDRNKALLAGKSVLLLQDVQEKDGANIARRYVFLPDGTSIDATLVAEGVGHASTVEGRYKSDIAGYEDQAKADKRGCLWK